MNLGADVNARVKNGAFPLYLSAKCKPTMLQLLLSRGADLQQLTSRGRNALHAVCQGLADLNIQVLLDAGLKATTVDESGVTPFELIQFKNLSPSMRVMLRELALIRSRDPTLELTDEKIIDGYPKIKSYYHACIGELETMRETEVFDGCTFYDVVAKNDRQLASLARNENFEKAFESCELDCMFPKYAERLWQAAERAVKRKDSIIEVTELLVEAGLAERMPDLVLEKIAGLLSPKYVFNDF